jgi:hypothetical protein
MAGPPVNSWKVCDLILVKYTGKTGKKLPQLCSRPVKNSCNSAGLWPVIKHACILMHDNNTQANARPSWRYTILLRIMAAAIDKKNLALVVVISRVLSKKYRTAAQKSVKMVD